MNLSDREKTLLRQYQKLSISKPSLINRLAVEIIPPVLFVALGIYTGQIIWFILVVSILVFYNVVRVLRQYNNIETLKSIASKVIDETESKLEEKST